MELRQQVGGQGGRLVPQYHQCHHFKLNVSYLVRRIHERHLRAAVLDSGRDQGELLPRPQLRPAHPPMWLASRHAPTVLPAQRRSSVGLAAVHTNAMYKVKPKFQVIEKALSLKLTEVDQMDSDVDIKSARF